MTQFQSTSSALDSINLLLNKHRENNYVIHEIDFESIGEGPLIGLSLSGEEDPWVIIAIYSLIHTLCNFLYLIAKVN